MYLTDELKSKIVGRVITGFNISPDQEYLTLITEEPGGLKKSAIMSFIS